MQKRTEEEEIAHAVDNNYFPEGIDAII